jgi:type II secretory pathway predicted ATPase ExeA
MNEVVGTEKAAVVKEAAAAAVDEEEEKEVDPMVVEKHYQTSKMIPGTIATIYLSTLLNCVINDLSYFGRSRFHRLIENCKYGRS